MQKPVMLMSILMVELEGDVKMGGFWVLLGAENEDWDYVIE
jgi:hypothetical protein